MGMTTFSARGQIVPGAATSWTVSEDGLTWTFYLRKDLRWSMVLHSQQMTLCIIAATDESQTAASLAYFMYMLDNAEAVNQGKLPETDLGYTARRIRWLCNSQHRIRFYQSDCCTQQHSRCRTHHKQSGGGMD